MPATLAPANDTVPYRRARFAVRGLKSVGFGVVIAVPTTRGVLA